MDYSALGSSNAKGADLRIRNIHPNYSQYHISGKEFDQSFTPNLTSEVLYQDPYLVIALVKADIFDRFVTQQNIKAFSYGVV